MTKYLTGWWLAVALAGCTRPEKPETGLPVISVEVQKIRDYVPRQAVIAHRGTTYWAPEETEPAYRWARHIGADYLELDLQMTRDSVLVALHDDTLQRTTNIAAVFPHRANEPAAAFTLAELRQLDAGTWFNRSSPGRAREAFAGQPVLTLEDVIRIATGYRIKRVDGKPVKRMENGRWLGHYEYEPDPADNGHRPGIYAETKVDGLEAVLKNELLRLGWLGQDSLPEAGRENGRVAIGGSRGRLVLQSFSRQSIRQLDSLLPGVPKCLLLWRADMPGELTTAYREALDFALTHRVQFIGPSIAGPPNHYEELAEEWMVQLIHRAGLRVHAYTFDTPAQHKTYQNRVDGIFTNRAELTLATWGRKPAAEAATVLDELGY